MIDAVALLKNYHAALNAFDLGAVSTMFAEDAVYVSPGLKGELKTRAAIVKSMRDYFAEYTDQVSQDQSIELLDPYTVKSTWSLVATSGKSGQKMRRSGVELASFGKNGLLTRVEVRDVA